MSLKHMLSMNECCAFWSGPSRGWSKEEVSYPGPRNIGGGAVASKIQSTLRCTTVKRKVRNFLSREARENVSLGPAVALDVPDFDQLIVNAAVSRGVTSKALYTL